MSSRTPWAVPLLCAAVMVLLVGGERRTDEEVVRDACRDLLEACAARDLHAVWDLHSAAFRENVRGVFEAIRSGEEIEGLVLTPSPPDETLSLADEDLFVRETREYLDDPGPVTANEPSGWAPWVMPKELLADLAVETVSFVEAGAMVRLRFGQPKRDRMRLENAIFRLVPEGGDWRFLSYEFRGTTANPPEPAPPEHEVEVSEDGPVLTVTLLGDRYAPDLGRLLAELPGEPARAKLVLRPDFDTLWRRVAGLVDEAARVGVRSFEVRPWSPPPERTTWFVRVDSVLWSRCSMAYGQGGGWMRFLLPDDAPDPASVDLIVEPGSWPGTDSRLPEWMAWLSEWDPDLIVLVDPHPDLPCWHATVDFDILERPGVSRILVARPAKDPGPVPEQTRLNGRPITEMRHPPKQDPDALRPARSGMHPVPEGHGALGRILR